MFWKQNKLEIEFYLFAKIQKITDYKEYKTQMSLTLKSLISRKLNIS